MKILLLTQVVPYPPDSGPKIKTYNVLRYLARRHSVHLVSFVRSAAEEAHARSLQAFCTGVTPVPLQRSRVRDVGYLARSLLSGRPFLIERDNLAAMHATVRELVGHQSFDAIHADQLSMAQFAENLPVPLRVLDEHNAVWTIVKRAAAGEGWGVRRWLAELEWRKLRAYEGQLCRRFDRVTVVSDEDRTALEEAAQAAFAAKVIPIAVDTHELAFVPRTPDARHVISMATMFYPPNVEGVHWFATEAFPEIRRAVEGTQFYVVGSRPPASITRLASPTGGIVVTGYVSDPEPLLRQNAVLVVPVHSGSGMRVKILEAFARGIPVVSTAIGVEGIDARHGEHLLVADEPREFAAAVIRLLQEPGEADRLARAGRKLVESRYDWLTALAGLDEIYPPRDASPGARAVTQGSTSNRPTIHPTAGVYEIEQVSYSRGIIAAPLQDEA
jgi:polysaccharide biosynthesis protein PslH